MADLNLLKDRPNLIAEMNYRDIIGPWKKNHWSSYDQKVWMKGKLQFPGRNFLRKHGDDFWVNPILEIDARGRDSS